MAFVGEKTKLVVRMHDDGVSDEEIARICEISIGSVQKRLKSFKRIESGQHKIKSSNYKTTYEKPGMWTVEQMKEGFDRFISENGRLPTSYEVDDTNYLPSSRQIQRRFGGLSKLRFDLGYADLHFGKGSFRGENAKLTNVRGSEAEDKLEKMLVSRFGELFVQSEKRFGDHRNRVDFVIYCKDAVIGIDVFATNEKRTIVKNIAVKLPKYVSFPENVPLYFVVWSDVITEEEIEKSVSNMSKLSSLSNLRVVGVNKLFKYLERQKPLSPPEGYTMFPRV